MTSDTQRQRLTLTVAMMNYNDAATLPRAIDAILAQSRLPDELIILDDGSTDNSVDIIRAYQEKYPFIKLLRHQPNQGIPATYMDLLHAAEMDYVYGASSNDWVLPGFFEAAMAMAERYPEANVIFGGFESYDAEGNAMSPAYVTNWRGRPGYYTPTQFLQDYLMAERAGHSLSGATIYRCDRYKQTHSIHWELKSFFDTFNIYVMGLESGVGYIDIPCLAFLLSDSQYSKQRTTAQLDAMGEQIVALMKTDYAHLFPNDFADDWLLRFRRQHRTNSLADRLWGSRQIKRTLHWCDQHIPCFPGTWITHMLSAVLGMVGKIVIRK